MAPPKVPSQRPVLPAPVWPWGGPRNVQERLLRRADVDVRKTGKKGDPKNPPLASAALLEFMSPGETSEAMRLPAPDLPPGHEAELVGFADGPHLSSLAARGDAATRQMLERVLSHIQAPPDRRTRMQALLDREAQMLELLSDVNVLVREIRRKMREEQREEGY
ncbi:MAG: hypothetical protein ACKVPX_08445 [Myxococcaceae bacterium]